jgi:pimeloyl-ACP methyl ester carboxylesterase
MKNYFIVIQSILLIYISQLSFGQQIDYGSNNGKYLNIFNHQIYYEEYGEGTPLLLFHGGTGEIAHYKQVIPELANNFRVIAIDTPGHGRSELPDTLSYQLEADYYSEFIDILKLDSVYVIGWSDGGMAAMLLAADRPDKVKRVMISGSNLGHSGYTDAGKQWVSSISPEIVEKDWGSWVKDYQSKAYEGNNFTDFILACKKMWDQDPYVPIEKVNKIKSRLLIVLGDRDRYVTLEHGIKMFRLIKGSELLVLPNTGHMVFWERPELITKIGIEFFKKN